MCEFRLIPLKLTVMCVETLILQWNTPKIWYLQSGSQSID